MIRALVHAWFTQPSPHIFLHFCILKFWLNGICGALVCYLGWGTFLQSFYSRTLYKSIIITQSYLYHVYVKSNFDLNASLLCRIILHLAYFLGWGCSGKSPTFSPRISLGTMKNALSVVQRSAIRLVLIISSCTRLTVLPGSSLAKSAHLLANLCYVKQKIFSFPVEISIPFAEICYMILLTAALPSDHVSLAMSKISVVLRRSPPS